MKFLDKKQLIVYIFLFIIILVAIYFFTRESENEFIDENELYAEKPEEPVPTETQIIVHITGEVLIPGIVNLPTGSRILDAITASGGTTNLADTSKVNLAYQLTDGQKVYIPSINDNDDISYLQNDAGENIIVQDISSKNSLININTASESELQTLTGIGKSTASKIIEYRNKNGKFKKIEEIMNVNGIGEAKFNNLKDLICI